MGGAITAINSVSSDTVEDYWNRVVCGVRVRNETNFKLQAPRYFIRWGILGCPPIEIEAGAQATMVGHHTLNFATGTTGVVTWDIRDQDLTLVVMWSAPFNFDFYSNCFAIGLKRTFSDVNESLYHELYGTQRTWFVRKEMYPPQFHLQPVSTRNGNFCVTGIMGTGHRCYLDIKLTAE